MVSRRGAESGFAAAIERFLTFLAAERGASPFTLKSYREDLRQLEEFLQSAGCAAPGDASSVVLRRFAAGLHAAGYAASSVARKLASTRSFFAFGQREGWVAANPAKPLRSPKRARKLPRFLTSDEIGRLLAAPKPGRAGGLRDRAILELMYSSGVRVRELVSLDDGDLDLRGGTIRVRGKGRRERLGIVGSHAREAIQAWLAAAAHRVTGARRPSAVHQPLRRPAVGPRRGQAFGKAPRRGGPRASRHAAHASSQLRDAPAGRRRRHPQRAGTARTPQPGHDADLHPRHDVAAP
jgi:integrase/recombinase XerC